MLPIKCTVLIGSKLKLPTIDWEPTRRAGIQLVCLNHNSGLVTSVKNSSSIAMATTKWPIMNMYDN